MKELGYYNGRIGELSEMTVPMTDRVCWFGDGVYDAQMVRNYRIFALDEHVDRFFRSIAALRMTPPFTKDGLKALLKEMEKYKGDLTLLQALRIQTGVEEQPDLDIGPLITNGKWLGSLLTKLRQPSTMREAKVPSSVSPNAQDRSHKMCP